jgi:ATP-dependent exoDNAse (exonuclease V) alpha subunit
MPTENKRTRQGTVAATGAPRFHLTLRVAWHDNRWNGTICHSPAGNTFCTRLDRIREERDEATERAETAAHDRPWANLEPQDLPPCKAESAAFMSPEPWRRVFEHPYARSKECRDTHGKLKPRNLTIPAYSAIAVPFWYMLRRSQKQIETGLPKALPKDAKPPFPTPWVFGKERQSALSQHFFEHLTEEESLVFFYTKEGHPLGDGIPRLIVAVGRIAKLGKLEQYDTDDGPSYPLWDRIISHTIRPDEDDGFLLPYHDYISPTGDPKEDARRQRLLRELAVTIPRSDFHAFSYAAELADSDVALSSLTRLLNAVRLIRKHGIAAGPWQRRETWINAQIAMAWKDRGAFPGTGVTLEALGFRLGTSLFLKLRSSGQLPANADPWPLLDRIVRGKIQPPEEAYKPDLKELKPDWEALSPDRRALLALLSRFDLTRDQAKRSFDVRKRREGFSRPLSDADIIANPYALAESDMGDSRDLAISIAQIDRGLLPDEAAEIQDPVPEPSRLQTPNDQRRIRCALVSVLRAAAQEGDSLLGQDECLESLYRAEAAQEIEVSPDWLRGHRDFLHGIIETIDVQIGKKGNPPIPALQLSEIKDREKKLAVVLDARGAKQVPSLSVNWHRLLRKAIAEAGTQIDEKNPRHIAALNEQAAALDQITTRKLSVLVGRAGTGKTSIVGALVACEPLRKDGLLLLAPTGKARVRLTVATGADAMTVAQFLYHLDRYDGERQRPRFGTGKKHGKAKTVVIDEASMLTMDYLYAVLEALDLTHVERVILVGDPNQLPPIGVGRPFADFVAHLETARDSDNPSTQHLSRALARLTVEVRAKAGAPSDALRLASWFTHNPVRGSAERIFGEMAQGHRFNDLRIVFWRDDQDLRDKLLEQFVEHLQLADGRDVRGFNLALGYEDGKWVKWADPDGVENFQILSPVRMHPYGVCELNRWVQFRFRAAELQKVRNGWATSIGDEGIVVNDKVIQLVNETRDCYDWAEKDEEKRPKSVYLANGEIGGVAKGKSGFLNVYYAGRPNLGVGYRSSDFAEDWVPLELAYALTIHKAQGSQFGKVFVVIPQASRTLSRELIYTALTRSREMLVLLIEGDDLSFLHDLSRPEKSDAASRNTNLFAGVVREKASTPPHAEHLIHRTRKGHMVRSKSELVIANLLFDENMAGSYEYEKPLDGTVVPGRVYPDFSFADAAGDRIIWEHLGMLDDPDYKEGWDWKEDWYRRNGYEIGRNLFTTEERAGQGLDSAKLKALIDDIKSRVI